MIITQKSSEGTIEQVRRRIRQALGESGIAEQINERSDELTENSRVVLQRR